MSNILNKSNHPIEIKKIPVRLWKLRDEIEAGIAHRILSEGNTSDDPVFIEDIKEYYISAISGELKSTSAEEESKSDEDNSNLDSSGNPMDDDALAMAAALGGGEDATDEAETESEPESTDEETTEDSDAEPEEEDAAAAELAAQMLADQGLAPEPAEDKAAEDLAAQMLADQGLGPAPAEDQAAEDLAAQMLADQGLSPTEENEKAPTEKERDKFKRKTPQLEKLVDGFVFLSDIQMDQIMIFSRGTFIHGQNIVIEFMIPNSFTQMVEVVTSNNIGRNSKIISPTKPDFRIQAQFQFKFPEERAILRNFLQTIEPDIPDPPKKLKRPESDEDEDDFDDLGF